jgi:hypothetical protein
MMKIKLCTLTSLILFLVVASSAGAPTLKERLSGKWKCIREHDSAKIVGGYMESIEFLPEELVLYYIGSQNTPFHCSYAVTKKIVKAVNLETKEQWNFDYKFLKNGDLYLHKEPWNWEGWFSRDFSKPRAYDPRDPKNISDYLRTQREGK